MDGLVELYTRHAYADYFVNKKTNQIFVKSEFILFDIENFPPLVEDGDEFLFALHKSLSGHQMSEEELLKAAKPKNILYYDRKSKYPLKDLKTGDTLTTEELLRESLIKNLLK